jgi:hypothetical protein
MCAQADRRRPTGRCVLGPIPSLVCRDTPRGIRLAGGAGLGAAVRCVTNLRAFRCYYGRAGLGAVVVVDDAGAVDELCSFISDCSEPRPSWPLWWCPSWPPPCEPIIKPVQKTTAKIKTMPATITTRAASAKSLCGLRLSSHRDGALAAVVGSSRGSGESVIPPACPQRFRAWDSCSYESPMRHRAESAKVLPAGPGCNHWRFSRPDRSQGFLEREWPQKLKSGQLRRLLKNGFRSAASSPTNPPEMARDLPVAADLGGVDDQHGHIVVAARNDRGLH